LKIWTIAIGEPLPVKGNNDRMHRCGLLNNILVEKGHNVVWWSSTFNHFKKTQYFDERTTLSIKNNYTIELLYGSFYKRNISFSRIRNHWEIGQQFRKEVVNYEKPEIIFCGFPSIELAYYATKYSIKNSIPIIIDARDAWPDVFLSVLPIIVKPIARIFLQKYYTMTKYIFSNATAITGITDGFVDWCFKYAGRSKTNFDRGFYLGYPIEEYDEQKVENEWHNWEKIGLEKDDFIISYVGAITKNKIELGPIINAARSLTGNSKVKFVIAGDGDDKVKFQNQIHKMGISNIILPGWINKYQIKSLLENSSLGLVPLRNRFDYMLSIPNKPLEYIANKLPIISSLDGELKKLINDKKIGVFYSNDADLVSIINLFLSEKSKLDEMAINCNNLFKNKFNADLIYLNLANHIQNLRNDKII